MPEGVFLSGQITLLSGVTLFVSPSGRLLGSGNVQDYSSTWAFLYSDGASNITVCGGGVVDGNYEAWIGGFDVTNDEFIYKGWPNCTGECRPRLALLSNSQHIVVANVTFTGSADWTFHLLNCSHVHVYNWTQRGDERWPNNDGIDIDSSSSVLLEDSDIDTADDGVCIKGSVAGAVVTNVTVRRCSVRSRSSAIKFGSNCPIPMFNRQLEMLRTAIALPFPRISSQLPLRTSMFTIRIEVLQSRWEEGGGSAERIYRRPRDISFCRPATEV